mgnify:FL=1
MGNLVRLTKQLSKTAKELPIGSLGLVVESNWSWGSCDHKVYFQSRDESIWVYSDEIELVNLSQEK